MGTTEPPPLNNPLQAHMEQDNTIHIIKNSKESELREWRFERKSMARHENAMNGRKLVQKYLIYSWSGLNALEYTLYIGSSSTDGVDAINEPNKSRNEQTNEIIKQMTNKL